MQNKNQSLSQSFRFLTLFVLMIMSVGSVWGTATTVTYTVTSTKAVSTTGTAPTNSSASYTQTYSNAMQATSENSMTLTLDGYAGYKITGIKMSMHSNSKAGAGTFSVIAGTTSIAGISSKTNFNSWYDNKSYGSSWRDVNVTLTNATYGIKTNEKVVINIACTANSLYCQSYAITYEADGGEDYANAPTLTETGSFTEPQNITITNNESGGTVYYTTDGSDPTTSSASFTDATKVLNITTTTTVKAMATATGKSNSSIISSSYIIHVYNSLEDLVAADITSGTTVKVSFENVPIKDFYTHNSNRNGVYFDIQKENKDIEIYYSDVPSNWAVGGKLSGTMTCPWKKYNGTWELAPDAGSWDWKNLTYTTSAATPTFSIATGTYYADQTVSLETTTDEASIYYTLDGNDPTKESTAYSAPITINKSCTLKAIACKDGMENSNIASAMYELKVTDPTVSVSGGVYSSAQNVELSTITPNAIIRYTLDGSDVTGESYVYSSAINVSTATTIKAKAFKNDWTASEQIEASYTFASAATIKLIDKGSQYGKVINSTVGANVVDALSGVTAPTSRSTMSEYTFKGWAQNQSTETPNIITDATIVPEGGLTLYAIYGKTADDKVTWDLVTDVSQLTTTSKVVIAAAKLDVAMSTTQNTNNRGQAAITKDDVKKQITWTSDVQVFDLVEGTPANTYAFYTGSGYLYAASSTANNMKTEATLSANSSWKITISDNVASIVAQGANTRNVIQYNSGSSLFSCYGSASQGAIELYKKTISPGTTTYDFEATDRSLTVTYNANGAEGDVPTCSTLYAVGEKHIVQAADGLTMEGNAFAYWTTDQAGEGTHYAVGAEYEFGETSVIFYAQWTPISYNVSVGEVEGATVTATYNTSETIKEGENAVVPYGTVVTLTATGLTANQNICWTVDGATVSASKGTPVTFTVGTSPVTISASVQNIYSYALVTSTANLVAGGQYILVSTKTDGKSYVANGVKNGDYLNAVDIPAPTDNVISITDENVAPIVLGKDGGNWFINMKEGQIGTSAAKKMTVGADILTWTIEVSDNVASIKSTTSGYGTVKYNRSSPRFLNYASGQADIYLYKLQETPAEGLFGLLNDCYTTFYTTDEFLMPEGAQGGVVNAKGDNSVTIDYLFPAGSVVPAGTPLLIKGTTNTDFTFTKTALGSKYSGINYLMGVPSANFTTVAPGTGDYYFYKLTYNNSTDKKIGFYWGNDDGSAFVMKTVGKAYLALPQSTGVKSINLDETTAIEVVNVNEDTEASTMFNLSGLKVGDDYKGIVIKNGKKFFVK